MNTLLLAGLVANAIINLRIAVLMVQDGEDRVQAGQAQVIDTICWQKGGFGVATVIAWTILAPVVSAFYIGKRLLFPRGIKSRFAKEEQARVKAEAEQKEHDLALAKLREHEALIQAWAPGEILLAPPEPKQVALGWHDAADAYDAAADLVARTAGQPWSPTAPTSRVKATVDR